MKEPRQIRPHELRINYLKRMSLVIDPPNSKDENSRSDLGVSLWDLQEQLRERIAQQSALVENKQSSLQQIRQARKIRKQAQRQLNFINSKVEQLIKTDLKGGNLQALARIAPDEQFEFVPKHHWNWLDIDTGYEKAEGGNHSYRDFRYYLLDDIRDVPKLIAAFVAANKKSVKSPGREYDGIKGADIKAKPGAKQKFDWDAAEMDFVNQIKSRGFPNKLNVPGWQTQADVVRYLQKMAQLERVDIGDSQTKKYARKFMQKHGHN